MRDRKQNASQESGNDEIYSKAVRAGRRTYFFDVKTTRSNDYYITITESKRQINDNGDFSYEKHKIFLYSEDFDKILDELHNVINFTKGRFASEQLDRNDQFTEAIGFSKDPEDK